MNNCYSGAIGCTASLNHPTLSQERRKTNKHLLTENSSVRKAMTNSVEPAC